MSDWTSGSPPHHFVRTPYRVIVEIDPGATSLKGDALVLTSARHTGGWPENVDRSQSSSIGDADSYSVEGLGGSGANDRRIQV
jgi:hypothetical protein